MAKTNDTAKMYNELEERYCKEIADISDVIPPEKYKTHIFIPVGTANKKLI